MNNSARVDRSWARPRDWGRFLIALAGLGAVITASAIPGVFTVDDLNHLVNVVALRQAAVTIRNTAGLPPSTELLAFDPGPSERRVDRTPVASTAPPLYAPIALPFSFFGLRGLIALNTLAYLVTAAILFLMVRRYTTEPASAWLASGGYALGSYTIEYAMGIWPHAVSLALTMGAIAAIGSCLGNREWKPAALAGLLLGIAAGVRYQNIVLLAAGGLGLLIWSAARLRAVPAFAAMACLPLAVSSVINHARLDSWNPVSKGPGYLAAQLPGASGSWTDPLAMFWAQVVDYSFRPELPGRTLAGWATYDPDTGAHLILGYTVKKALLQSAPWMAISVLVILVAWMRRDRLGDEQRRLVRFLSLPAIALVGAFAFAGVFRHDGMSFNQRYLLELVPLAAAVLAVGVDRLSMKYPQLLLGVALGVVATALALLWGPVSSGPDALVSDGRQLLILKVPLGLALLSVVTWGLVRARRLRGVALAVSLGVCLGWSLSVHVVEDLAASLLVRRQNIATTELLARLIPDRSAVFTYWGQRNAAVPLVASRDVVVLDAHADAGQTAPILIQALLAQNRRIFLLERGFPPDVRARVLTGVSAVAVPEATGLLISEVRPRESRAP